jgi:hypothetical protein
LGSTVTWTNATATYAIVSTNQTATDGAAYFANTTAGSFTITLPATPALNARVYIADVAGTFGTNNLVVARNGEKIMGLSENMNLNIANASVTFAYSNATFGWRLI